MKVFFACPSIDGKVVADFSSSMFKTSEAFTDVGIGSETLFLSGNAYVDLARDVLLNQFIKSDCTHILQLDADVGWEAEDVLRMLDRNVDFVAGVYPAKREKPTFMVNFNGKQKNGLIGATGVPGGFNLIKREAVLGAMLHHRDLTCEHVMDLPGEKVVMLHSHHVLDGRFWGEDMGFCRRMTEAGYEIWVDPYSAIRHWDGARCYDHKLIGTYLRENTKVSGSAQ